MLSTENELLSGGRFHHMISWTVMYTYCTSYFLPSQHSGVVQSKNRFRTLVRTKPNILSCHWKTYISFLSFAENQEMIKMDSKQDVAYALLQEMGGQPYLRWVFRIDQSLPSLTLWPFLRWMKLLALSCWLMHNSYGEENHVPFLLYFLFKGTGKSHPFSMFDQPFWKTTTT